MNEQQREKNRARALRFRAAHPGYSTQKTKELREKDPQYWQRWAEGHRENLKAADLRYQKKDPALYREAKRLTSRRWRENNPERNALTCLRWSIKKMGIT